MSIGGSFKELSHRAIMPPYTRWHDEMTLPDPTSNQAFKEAMFLIENALVSSQAPSRDSIFPTRILTLEKILPFLDDFGEICPGSLEITAFPLNKGIKISEGKYTLVFSPIKGFQILLPMNEGKSWLTNVGDNIEPITELTGLKTVGELWDAFFSNCKRIMEKFDQINSKK